MDNGQRKENRMGTQNVNSLLLSMAIPMIISMLAQALYNIVDTMFVSGLGKSALTALSLAFPVQNLLIAVSVGTGVGVNALLSKSLGEKNYERANKTADNGIFLSLLSMVVIMLLGIFASRAYFSSFGSSAQVVEYGTQYLSICMIASVGLFLQTMCEKLLQSTGKTMLSMITQLAGALINIVLDPIMIYGYFGCPKMGVAGAAAATVIGQIIAAAIGIFLNIKYNREITITLKGIFHPDFEIIKKIYSVGVPSIIMSAIGSVMTVCINQIVRVFDAYTAETAQAVFGIYFKLQSFIFMPVFGLNNGMVPILNNILKLLITSLLNHPRMDQNHHHLFFDLLLSYLQLRLHLFLMKYVLKDYIHHYIVVLLNLILLFHIHVVLNNLLFYHKVLLWDL